jgi:hypothetical protein
MMPRNRLKAKLELDSNHLSTERRYASYLIPGPKLLPVLVLTAMLVSVTASAQYESPPEDTPAARRGQAAEEYKESALRRFEIVTLISLPFTAIHSFLAVRSVEAVRQNQFAPKLSGNNFKVIGALAVSFSLFIGFWDWMHTHDKNPSEELIPKPPPPTAPMREVKFDDWDVEDSSDFVVPLVRVRF